MKRLLTLCALLAFTAAAGCNTFRGMGKDVERGGERMQGTASDVQKKM